MRPQVALVFLFFIPLCYAQDQSWRPVTPAELSATRSVDQTADAEVLFWDIRIEQSQSKTVLAHYIRTKIFTDRGVETQGRVDLPYGGRTSIKDISARTIQPDGSTIELKPGTIFERTMLKGKKFKIQAKSFALPNMKPGVLTDYRWTEVMEDIDPLHLPLIIQRDIPVQLFRLNIKPLSGIIWPLRVTGFNTRPEPLTNERGNILASVKAIPAFHEEPGMPPEAAIRPWLLMYYDYPIFWDNFATYTYESVKSRMKVTDDIRREAMRLVANVSGEEEKLRRIYEFCRTEIRRIDDDDEDNSVQRAADQTKQNKTPSDTLKRKVGTGPDIDLLFAALSIGAGFEAKYALLGDRERYFFDEHYPTPYMLGSYNVAVRLNNQWRFFDPAGRYLPFGMLRWQEEGVRALLVDPVEPRFETTTFSSAEKSRLIRSFTGRLEPDGTLEGDVRLVYFGHAGAGEKEDLDGLSANERDEYIRTAVQARMKSAEVSKIQIQNITDREQPIIETYHVRVPGYAQRIGKRIFLEPGYFQHGRQPKLSSSTRIHPVYVPYPWIEDDIVLIDLPEGFELDNADQPAAEASAGETAKHEMHLGVMAPRTLRYSRRMTFGADRRILFPVSEYPYVKAVFDAIEKRDSHSIAIKEGAVEEGKRQ